MKPVSNFSLKQLFNPETHLKEPLHLHRLLRLHHAAFPVNELKLNLF
jgi:hypothetical protein